MVVEHVNVKAIFWDACGIVAGSTSFQKDIKRYLMKIGKLRGSILGAALMLMLAVSPFSLCAASSDTSSIIVDGKTFSSGRNCKGDNWAYDASTHTLSLDGYNGKYIDLGKQDEVIVEISGSCQIVSSVASPAIMVEGSLILHGEGPLSLETEACHSAVYAKNGDLTVNVGTMTVRGKGEVADSAYLLMADGNVTISDTIVHIEDEITGSGGAIGSISGDVRIDIGSNISIS